ncbi:MAG: FAD-dependent hydroxylase [Chroococcus sp. CMT-3BRIN-NPC107]|jgi:2-octaprenyl-6-methoxyphenol hydroxylase|nr:FAD-dependent hydroxylase [Chroococcus sp. CMT-3BRIN-NPC107]
MVQFDSPTISSPSLTYDYDLAIAGGGIIGLTLASALHNSGLKVVVIEAKPQSTAAAKGQAYAVHLLSGRIFAGIGIWDEILPQIAHFSHVKLSDADYSHSVNFETKDLGTEVLGYVAEHQALLKPLQDFVRECTDISYLCPAQVLETRYQPSGVKISLQIGDEIKTIRTRLIVAADGAKSQTRQKAGINTRGWQYWQSCIVAFVKPEKGHNNTAYEKFWSSGPFAVLPLPENRCRIVWTAPHEEAKALVALKDDDFLAELTKRYGAQMGKLELVGDRFVFPVQLMQSDRYVLPRLALVGDAAHCCHPVGGQGLNMGIRDAAALAQVLQQAHEKGEDIGDLAILKRYESWRKQENLTILGFTDLLDRVFSNNFLPVVIIRRIGLLMLRRVPPIKIFALKLMTGLKGRTPEIAQKF